MNNWNIRMPWSPREPQPLDQLLDREWLVTNGLGGYASGTVGGAATRRYHSYLIAAHPAPLGRMVMLNHLMEFVRLPNNTSAFIGGEELAGGGLRLHGSAHLREFVLEDGLPVWRYDIGEFSFEKRVLLPHRQNTVHITYRLTSGKGALRLKLRPSVDFRPHESPVGKLLSRPYSISAVDGRYEIVSAMPNVPPLRFYMHGESPAFTIENRASEVLYRVEESRGYEHEGELWSPGYFRIGFNESTEATLVASTEPWEKILALSPAEARKGEIERRHRLIQRAQPELREGPAQALVLAADQFLIVPAGRTEDSARAQAAGEEGRSVIAGYHWFTDWGRDTMISLEGLTLCTGRTEEARWIIHTFAHHIQDGLLPNMFPEGEKQGLYHTADATLWFFHTIRRYLDATNDKRTLVDLLPKLKEIVRYHIDGTRFGIHVDPKDGLLIQGEEGYQLTWMDAKKGDWVVTPRRGKAVEINALWYNAIRQLAEWIQVQDGEAAARDLFERANQTAQSFNERFWYKDGGYLYDVVDGENGEDDPSLRPNQIFAFSLSHPVLFEERWESVLHAVRDHLLTPVGLRSLSPRHPDYKPKYFGDLLTRDAAYHQGTVWAWLIGPFIDAWLRVYPNDVAGSRELLNPLLAHLNDACLGSISEVFDAEAPFTARGCIAQAWSVAEVLRCLARPIAGSEGTGS